MPFGGGGSRANRTIRYPPQDKLKVCSTSSDPLRHVQYTSQLFPVKAAIKLSTGILLTPANLKVASRYTQESSNTKGPLASQIVTFPVRDSQEWLKNSLPEVAAKTLSDHSYPRTRQFPYHTPSRIAAVRPGCAAGSSTVGPPRDDIATGQWKKRTAGGCSGRAQRGGEQRRGPLLFGDHPAGHAQLPEFIRSVGLHPRGVNQCRVYPELVGGIEALVIRQVELLGADVAPAVILEA